MKNAAPLLSLLLLAGWGLLLARPQYSSLQDAQASRAAAEQTLQRDQTEVNSLPQEQQRAAQLAQRSANLDATLPTREGLAGVLRDLRVMAESRHVTLQSIARTAVSSPTPGIAAVTLNVSSSGSYPNTQRFLDDLHSTTRALTTSSGAFTAAAGGLNSSLKLVTYAKNLPLSPAAPCSSPTPPVPTDAPTSTPPQSSATSPCSAGPDLSSPTPSTTPASVH
ncbi:type 4a pilus biogenesis protein PilO [Deinococcus ruber]|uniref:Type 4a pilus biogenesis protein PilO n=1 Tax=Deinococcus ruber TaxID=1848197 RepID=A0A918F8D2_9DEIO|nr:type 4a pilus biogenesis protein PilO [Deinococcus ruber]GGR10080.1 hypothetical protein GCM10008957_23600 [Deinococcus ruber]